MVQTLNEQPTILAKPSFIAFLLSLMVPGLGQVYNGQIKKALMFFCLLPSFSLLFGLTRWITSFNGLLALFFIETALRIYIIFDGVKNAKRKKKYILKPYNTLFYHLLIAIVMITILTCYETNKILGVQTFCMKNSGGNPTLQAGDKVVADMRSYQDNEPDYGDIVIYSTPDQQFNTFRVVGRPNDHIELIDNIVSINGKPSKVTFINETTNEGMPVAEFEEELPNGFKHRIYKSKYPFDSTKINIKDIIVPSDSYYLLGDNRDNAADSRYEGFVSKDMIKGRIIYSYWGREGTKRMNIDFTNK